MRTRTNRHVGDDAVAGQVTRAAVTRASGWPGLSRYIDGRPGTIAALLNDAGSEATETRRFKQQNRG